MQPCKASQDGTGLIPLFCAFVPAGLRRKWRLATGVLDRGQEDDFGTRPVLVAGLAS